MTKNIVLYSALILSITSFIMNIDSRKSKMVYIEMGKLYGEFSLSKELNKSHEANMKQRKASLDSLFKHIQFLSIELKKSKVKTNEEIQKIAEMEQVYYYKEQQFEKANQEETQESNAKIWNQLNQYLSDFGKKKNVTFLFGANGQGSIMFANETNNVTQEAITYVNNRYNGIIID